MNKRFFEIFTIILILWTALILRITGVDFGLPMVEFFTGDSEHYVADAIEIANSGNWNPGWFGHPGSTTIYPLAIFFKFTHQWEVKVSQVDQTTEESFITNPTEYYVIGRVYGAFLGILTIAATYTLGKFAVGRKVGKLSAFLLAISALHISVSYRARTDAPVVLFMTLSVLITASIVIKPNLRSYIFAGMAAGLATSSKYYGILSATSLPAAHLLGQVTTRTSREKHKKAKGWAKLIFGFIFIPITFFISSPYFLTELDTVRMNLHTELRDSHLGADGLTPTGNAWWYASSVLPEAIGWVAVSTIVVGLLLADLRKRPILIPPIILVVFYFVAIVLHPLHWSNWLAPILPILTVVASIGATELSDWAKRKVLSYPLNILIQISILIAFLLTAAYPTLLQMNERVIPDTRQIAAEWIGMNVPYGSKIALEAYTAPIQNSNWIIERYFTLASNDVDYYCENNFNYLITSSAVYARLGENVERYRGLLIRYEELRQTASVEQKIEPVKWRVGGPRVTVYRLVHC